MRSFFNLLLWVTVLGGAIFGALYAVFFDLCTVPLDDPQLAASLAPNLAAGDVLVLSRQGTVGYGNTVRCADPQAPGRFVFARAIGHSGDKVVIDHEVVSVDGRRTPSPHACAVIQRTVHDPSTGDDVPLVCAVEDYAGVEFDALHDATEPVPPTTATVETGRWFLVSDNRHLHVDSRDYGAVDPLTCKHVLFRIVGGAGFGDSASRFTVIW